MDKKVTSPDFTPLVSDHAEAADLSDGCAGQLTRLELAVQQACEGLARWQAVSFAQASSAALTGSEITLLLLIASGGRAKTIKELARFTNRTDIPNIQYSLRKLASAGLTSKQGAGRSGVTYSLTEEGERVAAEMNRTRETLLLEGVKGSQGLCSRLENAAEALEILADHYGSAVRGAEAGGSV